jgi:hypothetical protein
MYSSMAHFCLPYQQNPSRATAKQRFWEEREESNREPSPQRKVLGPTCIGGNGKELASRRLLVSARGAASRPFRFVRGASPLRKPKI